MPTSPPSTPPVGLDALLPKSIGGHEITGILGSGGMGKVYLAKEPVLGREVALKVLKRDCGDLKGMQELLDEAVVTGRLGHPGIVPIYQVGKDAELGLWYTMKVVEGASLADILAGLREEDPATVERYTLPALLDIFRRVCDAVAFAHHHGVVNRDLKPSNVMIGEFGEVVVMDWGLARILDKQAEAKRFAAAGAAMLGGAARELTTKSAIRRIQGTPGYMSPEQALAQAAGTESDVYSLGAILYQILTQRLPIEGRGTQEMIQKTVTGQIVSPEKRAGSRGTPKALALIAMKALHLRPAARYRTARELARDVDDYVEGRVPWHPREEGWQSVSGAWDTQQGRLVSGAGVKSRIFHKARLGGDIRFHATVAARKDRGPTDVAIAVAVPSTTSNEGYQVRIVTGERARIEFQRNGALVSRRLDLRLDALSDHEIEISREGLRVRVSVDGRPAFDHREVFPMRGDRLGVSSDSTGVTLQNVTLASHGPPLTLDFLALPDKVHSMGQLAEARRLYREMAEAHADRAEGVVARYKAAQCSIELGELPEAQADLKLLAGTGYEALETLGQAKIRQKEGRGKEMWGVLLQGLDRHRGDPARLELRAMANGILEQAERESPAAARDLYLQLLNLTGLAPQETSQLCAEFLRLAFVAGGQEKVRQEALALLDAHRQRVELRLECHATLARMELPREAVAAARQHLERTLGLESVLTADDRARVGLWLMESHLASGTVGEAEILLASVFASLEPGTPAAMRIRQWRALLSCAQGRWSDAQKLLDAKDALGGGRSIWRGSSSPR